jgi:glucose 1-dehydrogenase
MTGPNFDMSGRVALITGSGRGIGLAMAEALASAGCAVAIQDIEQEVAEREAARIRGHGGRAVALGGDVTDLSLPPLLVRQTVAELGGLHVLINNAAIQVRKDWRELSVEEIEQQVRADQIAPLLLCQQAVPIFTAQKYGRIINLGSVQQRTAEGGMLAYAMSKAALELQTRVLARHLASQQVTVNMISPGYFDTWRNRNDFRDAEHKAEKGKKFVPLGRIGEPADCAGVALLLCSEAGGYITGQTIYVDGGITLRS